MGSLMTGVCAEAAAVFRQFCPDATDEEIGQQLAGYASKQPRNIAALVTSMGQKGQLARDLRVQRDSMHKEMRKRAFAAIDLSELCEHGTPGGTAPDPDSGLSWRCADCRNMAKAQGVLVTSAVVGNELTMPVSHRNPAVTDTLGPRADDPVCLAAAPPYPAGSLVGPLRDFVEWAVRDGLHPQAAGAAGLAALATLTGPARLQVTSTKTIRPIVWIALVGPASSGKSPAFEHAFVLIRRAYAEARDSYDRGSREARPEPLAFDDMTLEAMARWLVKRQQADGDASGCVVDDELAAFLQGLNQYKGGRGSDRARLTKLWSGAPLHVQRVGSGGRSNSIDLHVSEPVVSIAGALTPDNIELLGQQGSGFRPRFLLHSMPPQAPAWNDAGDYPASWAECLGKLIADRRARTWSLKGTALDEWRRAQARWRRQREESEPDDVIEALGKADQQCYRIALVIAESMAPGKGGKIPVDAVRCAAAIVDYVIGCWRALPAVNTMASSRAEYVMDSMSARFLAWLESRPTGTEGLSAGAAPRPRASRREIQLWAHLKPSKLDALIAEHEGRYPGCVVTTGPRDGYGKGHAGGKPTTYVYAPARTAFDVAATTKKRTYANGSRIKTAGQSHDASVLRLATPNSRNTETATPNGMPSAATS